MAKIENFFFLTILEPGKSKNKVPSDSVLSGSLFFKFVDHHLFTGPPHSQGERELSGGLCYETVIPILTGLPLSSVFNLPILNTIIRVNNSAYIFLGERAGGRHLVHFLSLSI